MKYLVTGGAGFIGSHIAHTLLQQGHSVRILDNFSTGKRENIAALTRHFGRDQLEIQEGDVRDASNVGTASTSSSTKRPSSPSRNPWMSRKRVSIST
jgi:nucleoside-diphosphate-sugar epimerase